MRIIILIIFLASTINSIAQTDSVIVTDIEICADLFRLNSSDSTYKSYYIESSKDTFYFENKVCVILYELTKPVKKRLRTKDGFAEGHLQWKFVYDSTIVFVIGEFNNGFMLNGLTKSYFLNGQLQLIGNYRQGRKDGLWTWYKQNGEIEMQCFFKNGVCEEE